MTTMTDHNISDLGTTLEAWVNVVRIDREVGRDPRTDRDAQRALARRNELMDELHAEALKINPRTTVVCATKCGLTGTTECPTDNEATWACPTC